MAARGTYASYRAWVYVTMLKVELTMLTSLFFVNLQVRSETHWNERTEC